MAQRRNSTTVLRCNGTMALIILILTGAGYIKDNKLNHFTMHGDTIAECLYHSSHSKLQALIIYPFYYIFV